MIRSAAAPANFCGTMISNYEYGEFLRQQLATQPPMNWAALYQQRPAPESGDYFKLEWLKPYERPPDIKSLRTYAASDYAVPPKAATTRCI